MRSVYSSFTIITVYPYVSSLKKPIREAILWIHKIIGNPCFKIFEEPRAKQLICVCVYHVYVWFILILGPMGSSIVAS